jgi:glutathione S-transferase
MKLYSFSPTPNNRKVEAFIKHYGLDVEIHSMNFRDGENKSEAYLKINPLGKAPVLVDGDFTLWESNAILTYIAGQFPETNAMPTDSQARADIDRWLHWQSFHFMQGIVAHLDDPEKAAEGFRPHLDLLNGQLEGRDFIRGDLSVVDFAISPYTMSKKGRKIDYSGHPNVVAWIQRCQQLKGFTETELRKPAATA